MRLLSATWSRPLGLVAAAITVSLAGCRDNVIDPGSTPGGERASSSAASPQRDGTLPTRPALPEFINAVKIDLPPNPHSYERDDAALAAAVRASGGQVHIGFKPASAGRTLQTGIIPGLTRAQALEGRHAVEAAGGRIIQTYRNSATIAAVISPEAASTLRKLPFVNFVEPLGAYHTFHEYPAEQRSWGVDKVRAPQVWSNGNNGDAAWVSILDTGMDQYHDQERFNGGDGNIGNFVCWAISTVSSTCWDDHGHGSHVTGIVNAAWNNGVGVVGISQPGGYAALKVCSAGGGCNESAIAAALDWTTSSGKPRHIVNMSLGGNYSSAIAEAVARAYNAGNLLIAAAGNTPRVGVQYPAALSQVIAVSGTLEDDSFASSFYCARTKGPSGYGGSVYGPEVEISAPFWARSLWLHLEYDVNCGTSMAAPVVSGVAALVWTRYPTWSNAQVRQRLQQTAIDLGAAGRDQYFGYGRVDALRAVYMVSVNISGPTYLHTEGTHVWEAMPQGGDGSYAYQWQVQWHSSGYTETLGTAKTQSVYAGPGYGDFTLSVTVTSAGQSGSNQIYVQTPTPSECGPMVIC